VCCKESHDNKNGIVGSWKKKGGSYKLSFKLIKQTNKKKERKLEKVTVVVGGRLLPPTTNKR
jgi:hypothetical protein